MELDRLVIDPALDFQLFLYEDSIIVCKSRATPNEYSP